MTDTALSPHNPTPLSAAVRERRLMSAPILLEGLRTQVVQQPATTISTGALAEYLQLIVELRLELESLRDKDQPAGAPTLTPEEIDDLPLKSVIIDADLDVLQAQLDTRGVKRWYVAGEEQPWTVDDMVEPISLVRRGGTS